MNYLSTALSTLSGWIATILWILLGPLLGIGLPEELAEEASELLPFIFLQSILLAPTYLALQSMAKYSDSEKCLKAAILAICIPALMTAFGFEFLGNSSKSPLGILYLMIFIPPIIGSTIIFLMARRKLVIVPEAQ